MSAHNDERRETGADEQEQGSSKKPKRSRRWAFLTLALPIALLAWSCAPKAPLPVTPTSKLAIGDAVIAVQLGEAQSQSGLESQFRTTWSHLLTCTGSRISCVSATSGKVGSCGLIAVSPSVPINGSTRRQKTERVVKKLRAGGPRTSSVMSCRMVDSSWFRTRWTWVPGRYDRT